jgi:hypothetical protein
VLLILHHQHRGRGRLRTDAVYRDALARHFPRQRLAERDHAALCRGIDGLARAADAPGVTTRPDDPPEKTFETDGCPLAGMEIRTVNVNGQVLPQARRGGCRCGAA